MPGREAASRPPNNECDDSATRRVKATQRDAAKEAHAELNVGELESEHSCETGDLPADAVTASLGCGNPTALLTLEPGQTVLDLGSGGGIDVLLSAKRVGPTGKAYGLDMTDEMLALARENQRKAGATMPSFARPFAY